MSQSENQPITIAKVLAAEHPDEIVSLYSFDNRCRYASPSHKAILGYVPESMIGKKWTEFVSPDDYEHANLAGDDALLHGESIEFSISARTKMGERIPLRGRARILADPKTRAGYLLFRASVRTV